MSNTNHPLYLIDAYGLIYRSYFAFLTRPLRNSAGKNVSALFGFARSITSLLNDGAPLEPSSPTEPSSPSEMNGHQVPRLLAAIFDSRTDTFRHKMYSEYKATRQKTPEDLHAQVPLVEEFLAALNIPALRVDGYEADDIIAALAKKCRRSKRQCYIISSDKDLLQLVGEGTYALRPAKAEKTKISGSDQAGPAWDLIGPAQVKAEWGVIPEKVLDLLSLTGDASDNIPGVKGIGEKTAADLINRYGSLDEIYRNIAGIEGAKGRKLAEGKDSAYFSQSLIRLADDMPLPVTDIKMFSTENLNRLAAAQVLFREGLRQSARQLDPHVGNNAAEGDSVSNAQPDDPQMPQNTYSAYSADKSLFGNGTYKIILDLAELKMILAEAKKQKLIALDFETDSLDAWNSRPIGISLALRPKEAYYVPVAPHGPQQSPCNDPEKVRPLLIPLFADPKMTVAAHNAKYDYKVSRGWGIDRWKCRIWDTMVAAWLADPERNNYSLDSLAA
ncbi:MAG: DNA polymerase I, partial [Treponema sp.]|nr:DNA polymerase I [Treponema sp.]